MRRKNSFALLLLSAIAAMALLLITSPQARAQQACSEFRAVGQAILPTPHPMKQDDTWGGDVYGMLGGEFLTGVFSGNDGNAASHGVTTSGTNGSYTFVFGTDSFTIEVAHASWPFPSGKEGLGYYRGAAKIVQGTGRFANSSGNLYWSGPFIVWSPDNWVTVYGRYNAEIRGNICGIQ